MPAADPRTVAPSPTRDDAPRSRGADLLGRLTTRLFGATPATTSGDDGTDRASVAGVTPDQLDAAWAALRDHDAEAVTARVDLGLAAGQLPGVALDVGPGGVTVAVSVLPVDQLVGPRTPVREAGGTRLKRADQARKHEVYAEVVDAAVLAVAGTTFAVAPGAARVTIAVVCPQHLGGPAVLLVCRCTRDRLLPEGATRVAVDRLEDAVLASSGDLVRDRSETLGALRPLEDEVPGIEALRRAIVAEH